MDPRLGRFAAPRIGGPLPVLHVNAWAHFYPEIGHGRFRVERWCDTGSDSPTIVPLFSTSLGPFDDTRPLAYAGFLWTHEVAKMTQWPEFLGVFPEPSRPRGVG